MKEYDHLGSLAHTYKEDVSGIIPTSMQTHNPYGGDRWTNVNLTETESTLLNWIGKEKDNESKLGDHGVRKYEYETGRFISIDPLWSSFYGWTPYQYSMNSPAMFVDIDGFKGKKPNYFGELVEPAKNEDFTFNNGFNGYIAGVANGYLFFGLGGEDMVPDYMRPFFRAGETTADYVSYATGPIGILKNTTKKVAKEGAEQLVKTVPKNRIHHIFNKLDHALESLVEKFGSEQDAFNAVQNAANKALNSGKIKPNSKGLLPTNDSGFIINVEGMDVRLIGGFVKDGKVIILSFSRNGL